MLYQIKLNLAHTFCMVLTTSKRGIAGQRYGTAKQVPHLLCLASSLPAGARRAVVVHTCQNNNKNTNTRKRGEKKKTSPKQTKEQNSGTHRVRAPHTALGHHTQKGVLYIMLLFCSITRPI